MYLTVAPFYCVEAVTVVHRITSVATEPDETAMHTLAYPLIPHVNAVIVL
jgi:hypothetical protein